MRFCELFSEYKILRKELYRLPLSQKILLALLIVALLIVCAILSISALAQNIYVQVICLVAIFLPLTIIHILSDNPKYIRNRIEKQFKPASEQRLKKVAKLLYKYDIQYKNKEQLKSLKEFCDSEKIKLSKSSVLDSYGKSLVALSALLIPPIVTKCLNSNIDPRFLIAILSLLTILLFAICSLAIGIKPLLYRFSDDFYYDELKTDLLQFELTPENIFKKVTHCKRIRRIQSTKR